jgi:cell division protein FtsL
MPGAFAPSARAGRARAASSSRRAPAARSARAIGPRALPAIRWDRLGRLAMLAVLAALLYLYLGAGIRMLSTLQQSHHDRATVAVMEREHKALVRQREALGRQGTIETQARQLGMKRSNERQYEITGLPAN